MAKNAKSCPAAIGTEELVAYLHTLLQENSHNMQNLWSDESNDATLPVKFQPETKRWKIAKAAMKAGRQVIKTHKDLAKAQRVPQRDVLEKALQMKLNKFKMLVKCAFIIFDCCNQLINSWNNFFPSYPSTHPPDFFVL